MSFIVTIQAVLAVFITLGILLQHRASGLSAAFGGGGTSYVQRRGAELFLFRLTVVFSIIFFVLTILDWYV